MAKNLITSALPYANGYIHLGHAAGAYLPADIYARFLRLRGDEVLYVCGSDEHGVAITIAAEKEKVTPKEIIDKYHESNSNAFERFGMSFDIYSRTSLEAHHETAREFFSDFLNKGLLAEKEEEQFYDSKSKMFLPDRYVEGECPNCGFESARGDQCDKCGAYYNQLELKNPRSLVSDEKPIPKKTIHWYFKFQEFQEFLENYIESNSKAWKDNVIQQSRSWLKLGLNERAITRDLEWGVKIDSVDGIDKEKAVGKALYVWFDAVLGYISATKEYYKGIGKGQKWKSWWQGKDTIYNAFIGKDNIVFHTLIFPALLHAKGEDYILPTNVPANEFLNLEGQKFSKSRNWSIDLKDFLEDFGEEHFVDALRYTLAANFPETKDADFTWKDFQARNNNELSAIFGNFVNRTLQFLSKNFGSKLPELSEKYSDFVKQWTEIIEKLDPASEDYLQKLNEQYPDLEENDALLISSLHQGISKIEKNYLRFRFRDAISETMNVARAANKYFNDEEPWKSAKTDPEKSKKTLFVCCQLVRTLAVLFAPIVPFASDRIYKMLNIASTTGKPEDKIENDLWHNAAKPILAQGHDIQRPILLFTRIEDITIEEQSAKLGNLEEETTNLISFDDFMNVKLRTAKVVAAEKIKKSKKLLKLQVDLGKSKRQIVAGIAEYYSPEDILGKVIVVVANLQPAKLMGHESQGMLLAANSSDGKLVVVTLNGDVELGAEVR